MMIIKMFSHQSRPSVRTTINLDDTLLEQAQKLTGIKGRTELLHEGLSALIERESARRLARLGGSDPMASAGTRRRGEADGSR